jgi:aryl-alcohol dehydrogenase-like predicted oxidoreductase
MNVKQLGNSGLKVSELVLGTMPFGDQVDESQSIAILNHAFESGIFTFDSADFYPFPGGPNFVGKTERILGGWVKDRGIRHQVVLATKGPGRTGPGPNESGTSRKHIMKAVEDSLQRLGGDYIDLYQFGNDPNTPLEETLRAMDDLVRHGKILYVGCNGSEAWWVTKGLWKSDVARLESVQAVQLRYNLIDREADYELLPLCIDQGLGVICFSPLAGGMLTGKYLNSQEPVANTRAALLPRYRKLFNDGTETLVREIVILAESRGVTPAQFALAWVKDTPGVTAPIIGVTSLGHLNEALGAVQVKLSEEELDRCDDLWEQLRGYDPKADRRPRPTRRNH